MKLLRIGKPNREKPVLIDKDGIFKDISSVIKDINPTNIDENLVTKLKNANIRDLPSISNKERIGPCVSNPQKFVGIGLNFSDHAEEQNLPIPKEPIIFFKSPSSITGPNDSIIIPKNSKKTDWEVELGFVISKRVKNINVNDSLNHILGFFIVNDVSEREWQKERCGQWTKGKSADTFGPIGPYILTVDELKDYQNLDMFLDLNGKRMQTGNTKKMIFNIKFLLSYLSKFMTLLPGDIVTTGTPPGVGDSMKPPVYLKKNDVIKLGISKLGEQNHSVIMEN